MKKPKFNYRSPGFVILLLLAILTVNTQKVKAQGEPTGNKLLKYELSIDLVPIIDQGQFGKVYFKMNHYKEDLLKGAFRFGVSKGIYFGYKYDESTFHEGTGNSLDNFSHFDTGLFLGYEKYKRIGPVLTYYGLDITGKYFLEHRVPETSSMDQGIITLGICPFWGIKHYVLKNRVSISFEIGWENSLSKNTNQYNGQVFYYTQSELQLPYNFTINYHF
jgi:hypothetical protein